MNSEKVKQIVSDALEVEPTGREALARQACEGDESLLAEVRSLLDAMSNASEDGFFAQVTLAQNPNLQAETLLSGDKDQTEFAPVGEKPGDVVGPYKLLQQIGEGGFGVVFMAEQKTPVKRRVALKVIKAGMDTRSVIARFEAERQALAMMDHPNIARVLDAGATQNGRPYFVMELVKGIPITDYCDQSSLDMRQRLALFIDVCQAVQHAHQKGIIHRDLKPSNVMVGLHDGKAVVKVIDFGIAKATEQKLTEKTLFTNYGQMIGTPAYMSPEQAVISGLDVDTRSDIYSLGVLLYELLAGSPPFDDKSLRSAGFEEMRRIIREAQPSKPSTKAGTLAPEVKLTVAARRQVSPHVLSRQLKGDLDWIVLKAIEKNRSRRYESASAFAQDIERHLRSEPVAAGAPGVGYRLRKFLRRNRGAVATATIILTLLLVGTGACLWEEWRTTLAEARERAWRTVVDAERQQARVKALLDSVQRAQVDYKKKQVENQMELCEEILFAAYDEADQFEKVAPILRAQLSLMSSISGGESPGYAGALTVLGRNLLREQKWAIAGSCLNDSLTMRQRMQPDDWNTFYTESLLGGSLLGQKRYADAEPLLLAGYKGMRQREKAMPPKGHVRLIEALDRLIEFYRVTNEPEELQKWQTERAKDPTTAPAKPG